MRYSLATLPLLYATAIAKACPYNGLAFPPPKKLSESSTIKSALEKVEAKFKDALETGMTELHGPVSANETFSAQIYSTASEQPLFDWHHRGQGFLGNRTVDGDSIYRVASITKLFTVYMLLLQAGDGIFNDPVVKYLPELAGKSNWDEITVGSLAGYTSGVLAEIYGTESLANGDLSKIVPGAFPDLEPEEISPCVYNSSSCTRETFLKALPTRRAVFLPNTSPNYSNAAFAALGLVLETITGQTYNEAMEALLSKPLGLTGTTGGKEPDTSRGVIWSSKWESGWNLVLAGAGAGMGAMYSSPNDLQALGREILSSGRLSANTTRAWYKPTSLTSDLIGAVGHGWEIYRAEVGPKENNRVLDLYTKAGNVVGTVGGYGAMFVLIPEFNIGFHVMAAGLGKVPYGFLGILADEFLPALDEAAREEAAANYVGTYVSTSSINSTVILSSKSGLPGLTIDQWVINGTSISEAIYRSPAQYQMYPTNVMSEDGKELSWRASYLSLNDTGPFSACPSWVGIDRPNHGIYPLDEFIFHLNDDGKAEAVEMKAFKTILKKE